MEMGCGQAKAISPENTKAKEDQKVTQVSLAKEDTKPKVSFVLGGPGCGKGTQCAKLVSTFPKLVHLSAGQLLREEMATDSEDSKLIDYYIKEGKIVPVKITCRLLKKAMQKHGWGAREFLVDGYPRNMENYEGWVEEMGDSVIIMQAICFECPKVEPAFKEEKIRK